MEGNWHVFNGAVDEYAQVDLRGAEFALIERFARHLSSFDLLDLGVGGGRTAHTFAPLVNRYVGVDYAPPMVEHARSTIGEREGVEFVVADARDLTGVEGAFDLALFSFNGIDAVGHEDRKQILAEVRRKLKPDGIFFFSSHSLGALPLSARRRRRGQQAVSTTGKWADFARDLHYGIQVRRSNRLLDLQAARARGWAIVRDPAHHFSLAVYYVAPTMQLKQLVEAGFKPEAVIDERCREVNPTEPRRDAWFSYLCRKGAD